MKRRSGWPTALCLLLILTLGCNFFSQVSDRPDPISHVAPTLPSPPKPLSAPKGTPEEQAVHFANLLASGDNRLADWLGVYDALGVPVLGQDGAALGSTGADPMGPRFWQVWYASGLDMPGRGIPLSDAGRLLAAGFPGLEGAGFGATLLNDLKLAAQSSDPQVRLMGMFVRERIKRWPSHLNIQDASVTAERAIIDLPTLQMLGWILMRGRLFQAASSAGKIIGAVQEPVAFSNAMFRQSSGGPSPQTPCSEKLGDADNTYWTNWLRSCLGLILWYAHPRFPDDLIAIHGDKGKCATPRFIKFSDQRMLLLVISFDEYILRVSYTPGKSYRRSWSHPC